MNNRSLLSFIAASFLCAIPSRADTLMNSMTYQGRLLWSGAPAEGAYDIVFQPCTNAVGMAAMGMPVTNLAVQVHGGLFTTFIKFPGLPNGYQDTWMELSVRSNGVGAYTTLFPRQPVTPQPYAWFANMSSNAITALSTLTVAPGAVTAPSIPDGVVVRTINGQRDNVILQTNFWGLSGNAGLNPPTNFIGTTDYMDFHVRVGNVLGWRLVYGSGFPSVVGGNVNNTVDILGRHNIIGAGFSNRITGNVWYASILGGEENVIEKTGSWYPDTAVIGGGYRNTNAGYASVVPGGYLNHAFGSYSLAAGTRAKAMHQGTFVWGDYGTANFSSTANNQFLVRASGGVGIGTNNPQVALHVVGSVMASSFIGGLNAGGLAGTLTNMVTFDPASGAPFAVGNAELVLNLNADLLDGVSSDGFWRADGNSGITEGQFLGTIDNMPLEFRANNYQGLTLQYINQSAGGLNFRRGMNVRAGYWGNAISNGVVGGTVAGGGGSYNMGLSTYLYPNVVSGNYGTVGGGNNNIAGSLGVVPGGSGNVAGNGSFAAGVNARASNVYSFVWSDGLQIAVTDRDYSYDVYADGGVAFYNGLFGVTVDGWNMNSGNSIAYGLRFGPLSGEGIASKRTAGANQYGLDFYTGFENRMTVHNNGYLGIGTTAPEQILDVNGWYAQVRGAGGEKAYIGGDGVGADVQLGSLNPAISNVVLWNAGNNTPMELNVKAITILGGADLAEPFEMSGGNLPVGSVVVIDEENPGQLKISQSAYDTRVAGIISGAKGVTPGIQMKQSGVMEKGQNVALSGRVYVLADASGGAIKPGDLLTTATVPGHAMRVADPSRATGAVLGKAMTGLKEGKGLVLVLVSLQ